VSVYPPFFKMGDFVSCSYERFPFLYDLYDDGEDDEPAHITHHGIVVYVDNDHHDYLDEYIYEVLCLDGIKRLFLQSELKRVHAR